MVDQEIPVLRLRHLGTKGLEFQRLDFGGTHINAIPTSGTIKYTHLDPEIKSGEILPNCFKGYHVLRSAVLFGFIEEEGPYGSVRTNEGTMVTLDTVFGQPQRNIDSNSTFFQNCGS